MDELIFTVAGPIVNDGWTDYTFPISVHLGIDPIPIDNPGTYLNHSCEPSAGIKGRTLIVAYRDIAKGEEIVLDYAMLVDEYGDEITDEGLVCRCGSATCRRRLGSYVKLPDSVRKAYRGYISDWLLALNI